MLRDEPQPNRDNFSVLGILLVAVLICELFGLAYPFEQFIGLMIALVLVLLLRAVGKREQETQ
jgi:hypothetical protein